MTRQELPLVTIGIPTFNGSKHIKQALQSAINQDYGNIEIIVSDNASTDNTQEICELISDTHHNVTYIRHETNIGPTLNFNFLLTNASGAYFMWLGDDDWIDHNYVSLCAASLTENTGATIVSGRPKYYMHEEFLYCGISMNIDNPSPTKRVTDYFSKVKHNGIFYGLMRTELITKILLTNVMGGDLLFIASLVFLGEVRTIEKTFVHRRRGGSSSDSRELSKIMSLPWLDYNFPRTSIAINTMKYIMESPSFSPLSKSRRFILSIHSIGLATLRKILSLILRHNFVEQSATPKKNGH